MSELAVIRAASTARVGPRTTTETVNGFVVVQGTPATLADDASLDVNTYALARMLSSEENSGSAEVLLALAEAARNQAARRGRSVYSLLTSSKYPSRAGRFGAQKGAWASTRLDPNGRHVAAAQVALGGSDFTGGARDFFDPRTQDGGVQLGEALRLTSEQYIADRAKEGLFWVGPLPGIDPYKLMLFRDGHGDVGEALAVLEHGRGGGSAGGGGAVLALLLIVGVALAVGA